MDISSKEPKWNSFIFSLPFRLIRCVSLDFFRSSWEIRTRDFVLICYAVEITNDYIYSRSPNKMYQTFKCYFTWGWWNLEENGTADVGFIGYNDFLDGISLSRFQLIHFETHGIDEFKTAFIGVVQRIPYCSFMFSRTSADLDVSDTNNIDHEVPILLMGSSWKRYKRSIRTKNVILRMMQNDPSSEK